MTGELRRTPLFGKHTELGGKLVPFAGYEMPLHYEAGIRSEHQAVRSRAGLFDVSHMGEIELRGPEALSFLRRLAVNDAAALEEGRAQYSALCRPDGGVIDDLLVYRFADHFMLVVNAANRERVRAWILDHADEFRVEVEDRSEETALLALQGPRAEPILAPLTDVEIDSLAYYRFREGAVAGVEAVVSRTGYTGEDGFELYVAAEDGPEVWDAVMEEGVEHGLVPAGLGCRDSLRLEMGYALHGQDLDEAHTPLEAGLSWIVDLDEGRSFLGSEVLRRQRETGVEAKLVGLGLEERGFPRAGYEITREGAVVGTVTSGTVSPTLERGIALGYVPAEHSSVGTELAVRIRSRDVAARVERLPFYTEGSLKR